MYTLMYTLKSLILFNMYRCTPLLGVYNCVKKKEGIGHMLFCYISIDPTPYMPYMPYMFNDIRALQNLDPVHAPYMPCT
jgi:hypothetical protein